METQSDWPARLTAAIAQRIRRHRLALDWSAQQLADRCAELGMDIPRTAIADFENGRRERISVAEVLVIAAALGLAPVLLLAGVGTEDSAEILPGQDEQPFRAAQWIAGEGPLPQAGGKVSHGWVGREAMPLILYRDYYRFAAENQMALVMSAELARAADAAEETAPAADAAALRRAAAGQQKEAREYRARGWTVIRQLAAGGWLAPPGPRGWLGEDPGPLGAGGWAGA